MTVTDSFGSAGEIVVYREQAKKKRVKAKILNGRADSRGPMPTSAPIAKALTLQSALSFETNFLPSASGLHIETGLVILNLQEQTAIY